MIIGNQLGSLPVVLLSLLLTLLQAQRPSKSLTSTQDNKYAYGVFTFEKAFVQQKRIIPAMDNPILLPFLMGVQYSNPFSMVLFRQINLTSPTTAYISIEFQSGSDLKNFKVHVGYLVTEKLFNIYFYEDIALKSSKTSYSWTSKFPITGRVKYLPFITAFTSNILTDYIITSVPSSENPNFTISLVNVSRLSQTDWIEIVLVAVNLDDKVCPGVDAMSRQSIVSDERAIEKIIEVQGRMYIIGLSSLQRTTGNFLFDVANRTIYVSGKSRFQYNSIAISMFCRPIANPAANSSFDSSGESDNATNLTAKNQFHPVLIPAWVSRQTFLWGLSILLISLMMPADRSEVPYHSPPIEPGVLDNPVETLKTSNLIVYGVIV